MAQQSLGALPESRHVEFGRRVHHASPYRSPCLRSLLRHSRVIPAVAESPGYFRLLSVEPARKSSTVMPSRRFSGA